MSSARELLESIYRAPDDDAARQAYADFLIKEGDPRGEVIALQLSGGDPARVTQIIEANSHKWLGALKRMLDEIQFERGFPARARGKWSNDVQKALHDVSASTIRALAFEGMSEKQLTALVADAELASRVVSVGTKDVSVAALVAVLSADPLPGLRGLSIVGAEVTSVDAESLLRTPAGWRLTELACTGAIELASWIELMTRAQNLETLVLHHGLQSGRTFEAMFTSKITRSGSGFAVAIVSRGQQSLAALAAAFTPGLAARITTLVLPDHKSTGAVDLDTLVGTLQDAGFSEHAAALSPSE